MKSFYRISVLLLVVACLAVFLFSCKSTDNTLKKEKDLLGELVDASNAFNKHLKWRDMEFASNFVDLDMVDDFNLLLDEIKERVEVQEINTVKTEILEDKKELDEDGNEIRRGRVHVKLIGYSVKPYFGATDVRYVEEWIYKNDTWMIQIHLEDLLDLR